MATGTVALVIVIFKLEEQNIAMAVLANSISNTIFAIIPEKSQIKEKLPSLT